MFRRFFWNDKTKVDKAIANGQKVNGVTNDVSVVKETNGTTASGKTSNGVDAHTKEPSHAVSRQDVESSFTQFAQLVHAAQRPLPNQTGDGTYVEDAAEHASFSQDLRSLGLRDVKTLTEVMKSAASGALVDDKTMFMERVIQVSCLLPF